MIDQIKKLAPFLDEFLPEDYAVRGIEKISPKIGKFLKNGMQKGLPIAGGLDFLRRGLGRAQEPIDKSKSPHEQATQRMKSQAENENELIKGAGSLALGAAGGLAGGAVGSALLDSIGLESAPQKSEQQQSEIPDENNIIDQLWERVKSGKLKVSDSDTTAFLKMSNTLHKMRGLNDKNTFADLYAKFLEMRESAPVDKVLDQLMMMYNQSLSKGGVAQPRGQPQNDPMNNLMQVIQAATQARQNRQGR